MKRIVLATLFASATALAGPYDQPYSQISTDRRPSADPLVIPVIVNRVDDVTVYNHKAVVPPGPHKVTVDVHGRKGFPPTQVTFDLETKVCTRYYVSAKLKSPTLQEWTPFVRSEEPLLDCAKKFHIAATGAQ
jgi:hypothetical protein